jgi:recombinational DNA repair ATPase RecF
MAMWLSASGCAPSGWVVLLVAQGPDRDVHGSCGRQRHAALPVKLAELASLQAETGELSSLLLDAGLSTLEEERLGMDQVLLTTPERALLSADLLADARYAPVVASSIHEMT